MLAGVQEKQQLYDSFSFANENEIASYHYIRERLDDLAKQFQEYLTRPQFLMPFLQPGRLVKVSVRYITSFYTKESGIFVVLFQLDMFVLTVHLCCKAD